MMLVEISEFVADSVKGNRTLKNGPQDQWGRIMTC